MQRAFNLSNDSQTTKFGVDEDQALAFRSGGPRQTRRRSLWIDFLIEDAGKTDEALNSAIYHIRKLFRS
jgi:hypothetical protein